MLVYIWLMCLARLAQASTWNFCSTSACNLLMFDTCDSACKFTSWIQQMYLPIIYITTSSLNVPHQQASDATEDAAWKKDEEKVSCHEPRYWSAMDWYKTTLLQGKQAQDASLGFPNRLRPRWTTGNSHWRVWCKYERCRPKGKT